MSDADELRTAEAFRVRTVRVPGGKILQVGATHWKAQCHVCPKRLLGRHNFDTLTDAAQWFTEQHLAPDSLHWLVRYEDPRRKAKREVEEALLRRIFKESDAS